MCKASLPARCPLSKFAAFAAFVALGLLAGCATVRDEAPQPPPPPLVAVPAHPAPRPASVPRYRCDHDIAFTVKFGPDSAVLDAGPKGTRTLMRDAGGVTPEQTVYSSTDLKAEFGLGEGGREAVLRYAQPALEARCERETP